MHDQDRMRVYDELDLRLSCSGLDWDWGHHHNFGCVHFDITYTYTRHKADERPIRFWLEGKQYAVEAVLDQWYDRESIFYRVRADDGNSLHSSTTDLDARWTVGVGLVWPGRIGAKHPELATANDPHLPPVQRNIENADEDAGNRQNGWGDVGIDQLVQVMEQKATLVRLQAGLGFEPVLQHS